MGIFKLMVIETIFDIIPYALVDPAYVAENYNDNYNTYGITCDISNFMVKDPEECLAHAEEGQILNEDEDDNAEEVVVDILDDIVVYEEEPEHNTDSDISDDVEDDLSDYDNDSDDSANSDDSDE